MMITLSGIIGLMSRGMKKEDGIRVLKGGWTRKFFKKIPEAFKTYWSDELSVGVFERESSTFAEWGWFILWWGWWDLNKRYRLIQ